VLFHAASVVVSVPPVVSSPPQVSPLPTSEATAPLAHHRGSDVYWILLATLATLVLGLTVWIVLGRDKQLAIEEGNDDAQPPDTP